MDNDDPKTRHPQEPGFEPEPGFDDDSAFAPQESGEPAAPMEEESWQDEQQPVDDFTDSEPGYADEAGLAEPQAGEIPEGEDVQDAEYEPADFEDEDMGEARSQAEQYLPPGMADGNKPAYLKYLPYAGGLAVLTVLGVLGWQQIQGMMAAPEEPEPSPFAQVEPLAPPREEAPPPKTEVTKGPEYILEPVGAPQAQPQEPARETMGTAPLPPASVPQQMESPLTQEVAALRRQLDEIRGNQERIDSELRALRAAPPPPPAADDGMKANLQALEEKIARLEQRVNKPVAKKPRKKKTSKKTRTASSRAKSEKKASSDFMASRLQREVNARMGRLSGARPSTGSYGTAPGPLPTATPYPARPAPKPKAGGGWILRSAQPGSAWISEGMSTDLRRIVPGDKVPGLGTIVSIRMVAGHWLVEGTQGSVR